MSAPRALTLAVSTARDAERWLPVGCGASAQLLALLVRATELEAHGTEAEMLALARRLTEAAEAVRPPAPAALSAARSDPLLEMLEEINPAEAAWLVAARARHAEYLRAVAEARSGQASLTAQAPAPDRPKLPSTIDRPALQRGLWEAARAGGDVETTAGVLLATLARSGRGLVELHGKADEL